MAETDICSSIGLFYVPALKCSHNKKSVKSESIFFSYENKLSQKLNAERCICL